MSERQGQRNRTMGHRVGKTLLAHGVGPCHRSPVCSVLKAVRLFTLSTCAARLDPGSQLFSGKKCKRKAVALCVSCPSTKDQTLHRLCFLHPQAFILPGDVSTLPKEQKLLLILIPELYVGHLGWRNMNLSLSSRNQHWLETNFSLPETTVGWFWKDVENIISSWKKHQYEQV